MPTFQVTCVRCGKDKWPTLPERPKDYICALCRAVAPEVKARRQEGAQKRLQTLRQTSKDKRGEAI